jgi:hypothetical protein
MTDSKDIEFVEKENKYTINIQPHLTTARKTELHRLINSVDGCVSLLTDGSYACKDSYEELISILDEFSFTHITTMINDNHENPKKRQRLGDVTNNFKAKEVVVTVPRDQYLIEVVHKLRVCSLIFAYRGDIVEILKTIPGRFWSRQDNSWYLPLAQLQKFQRKVQIYDPLYKFKTKLNAYELLEQSRQLEEASSGEVVAHERSLMEEVD